MEKTNKGFYCSKCKRLREGSIYFQWKMTDDGIMWYRDEK